MSIVAARWSWLRGPNLWSQEATTAFYEGTGILSAVLALLTTIATGIFIYRELPARKEMST